MPKKRTKTDYCLNCGHQTGDLVEFCPLCGQENSAHNIPSTQLIGEFLSNYLALDSRFLSSLKPFFFKPGFLTNRFNEGLRVRYTNPVRLYVVTSVIYFFIMSLYLGEIITTSLENNPDNILNIDSSRPSLSEQWNDEEFNSAKLKLLPDSVLRKYAGIESPDSILTRFNEDLLK